MKRTTGPVLSVVVPAYNEGRNLPPLHKKLIASLESLKAPVNGRFEIIYCDDGSSDNTPQLVAAWHRQDKRVKSVRLSRNFGKENALAAGIAVARGQAIVMLDGDGQHPPALIPKFVRAWRNGTQVVIGLSTDKQRQGLLKRVGTRVFYGFFNRLTGQKMLAGATDYRLIDRSVQQAFLQLHESNRVTRGLIDWLGFKREFINFRTAPRAHGRQTYDLRKLMQLAANSFVSSSPKPLYMFGYLGIFITIAALILGTTVFIEQLVLDDPLNWNFTGTAMLGILILFLVGLLLLSQGILSLYISHIHSQSMQRPLYVVDYDNSVGISFLEDDPRSGMIVRAKGQ